MDVIEELLEEEEEDEKNPHGSNDRRWSALWVM